MAVAPIEYPPPVDPAAEFIGPPTDPEDERIEVGVAIVGGGPGRPGLRHPAAAAARGRPRAGRVARRGARGRDREGPRGRRAPALGRGDEPGAAAPAPPGRRLRGRTTARSGRDGLLHAQPQAGDAAEADAAAVPQPRQLRRLASRSSTAGWASRRRRRARTSWRRPPGAQAAASQDGVGASACAPATRAATRPAARRPTSSRGRRRRARDRARRGLLGAPHRRGAQGPRAGALGPAGVGARRQGGVGGRASRSRRWSTRSAGRCARRRSTRSSAAPGSTA